jgi:hypothetical protein
MEDVIIGFCGPLPILAVFLILFWHRLEPIQRLGFFVIVYIISVATGILFDVAWEVGNTPSAVIAGFVAPIVYCFIFSVVLSLQRPRTTTHSNRGGWDPVIVTAIIQAVATIIVALIAKI